MERIPTTRCRDGLALLLVLAAIGAAAAVVVSSGIGDDPPSAKDAQPARPPGHMREDGVFTPLAEQEAMCPYRREREAAARGAVVFDESLPPDVPVPFVPPDPPTNPMGVARGVIPGRVAWVRSPYAVWWNGWQNYYWLEQFNDQALIDLVFSEALCTLTGATNGQQAWESAFKYFNETHGRGIHAYKPGETIVIKGNFVGCHGWGSPYYQVKNNEAMTTHMTIRSLLRQLVNIAGVPQTNITLYEGSTAILGDMIYLNITGEFPHVHYADTRGQEGRELIAKDLANPIYCSNGAVTQHPPTCVTSADYMINIAALKSHEASLVPSVRTNMEFVTLCSKNHFGSLCGSANDYHPYIESSNSYGTYHILPDLMEHRHLGNKTMLFILDALYGGLDHWDAIPKPWFMPPFNTNWPASVFMSFDNVAIDSVGVDFLRHERALQSDPLGGTVDSYLHEAAQITSPPSGIVYDPDGDGPPARSLGVHEHWADAEGRQYTRNISPAADNGIELAERLVPDAPYLRFVSFAVAEAGDTNGYIEPGEAAELRVIVRNVGFGGGPATNARAVIEDTTGYFQPTNPAALLGQIATGDTASNVQPFVVRIATNCPQGIHSLRLVTMAGGGMWTNAIPLAVQLVPHARVGQTNIVLSTYSGATNAPLDVGNTGAGVLSFAVTSDATGSETNYTWCDSGMPSGPVYSWVDIATQGVALALGDDAVSNYLSIGFAFPYYLRNYSQFWVCANGRLGFEPAAASSAYRNRPLPATSGGPCAAPFWQDLNCLPDGVVRYYSDGARLVVSWLDVVIYGSTNKLAFQAIIGQDGVIVFQYKSMSGVVSNATVGIQATNAPAPAVQVAYREPYVKSGLAVAFKPGQGDWLSFSPQGGTVPAWSVTSVWVYANAANLTEGVYRATAVIAHNGTEGPIAVPVELIVPEPAGAVIAAFLTGVLARRRDVP